MKGHRPCVTVRGALRLSETRQRNGPCLDKLRRRIVFYRGSQLVSAVPSVHGGVKKSESVTFDETERSF